jgi:aryl-alcohol dehydrogenase
MKITAAVVHERSGPFIIEQLDLCDPRNDELLVEVVASGMCATDLHGRDDHEGQRGDLKDPGRFH